MQRMNSRSAGYKAMNHVMKRMTALCLLLAGAGGNALAAADISGPWEVTEQIAALKTLDGKAPPLTVEGRKRQQLNKAADDPMSKCLPPGIPRALMQKGFPFSIVMGERLGGMFIEWNHLPRPIYMDTEHFENIGPTYLGQSVGKWEGDTLVIHTNGFNDLTWLDASGLPHSEALVTVERIRLKDANTLENRITFTDAEIFSQPWTAVVTFKKRPGYIVKEDYCFGRTGQGVTKSVTTK